MFCLGLTGLAVVVVGGILALPAASDWLVRHDLHPRSLTQQRSLTVLRGVSANEFDAVVAQPLRDNITANLKRFELFYGHQSLSLTDTRTETLRRQLVTDGAVLRRPAIPESPRLIAYRGENLAVSQLAQQVYELECRGVPFTAMGRQMHWAERFLKYDYISERLSILAERHPGLFAGGLPGFYERTHQESLVRLSLSLQIPIVDIPKLVYVNNIIQRLNEANIASR